MGRRSGWSGCQGGAAKHVVLSGVGVVGSKKGASRLGFAKDCRLTITLRNPAPIAEATFPNSLSPFTRKAGRSVRGVPLVPRTSRGRPARPFRAGLLHCSSETPAHVAL